MGFGVFSRSHSLIVMIIFYSLKLFILDSAFFSYNCCRYQALIQSPRPSHHKLSHPTCNLNSQHQHSLYHGHSLVWHPSHTNLLNLSNILLKGEQLICQLTMYMPLKGKLEKLNGNINWLR